MDFFAHQDQARAKTGQLVLLFSVAVALLVSAITAVIVLAFPDGFTAANHAMHSSGLQGSLARPDWEAIAVVAATVLTVIALASLYKTTTLAFGGGKRIAESLGGRPIYPGTQDPDERRLINVVEEMSLASGMPVPELYVMEGQPAINAFAAGTTPDRAVIGVTDGCMRELSRDELQGVIAHEFSHIANGDMRINLRLIGVLFGILFLQQAGILMMHARGGGRRRRDGNQLALVGIACYVLGAVGLFFGAMIKAAVSRQREFFADASAVQFTRNPAGIAGALRRIGGLGSHMDSAGASEVSHMFFARGVIDWSSRLFATHPPLDERVARIEGGRVAAQPMNATEPHRATPDGAVGFAGASSGERDSVSTGEILKEAGSPSPARLSVAATFLREIPGPIREAVHDPFGARAAVYCAILGDAPEHQVEQLEFLKQASDTHTYALTCSLLQPIKALGRRARLPIMDLSLPALRRLSKTQTRAFLSECRGLALCDKALDIREYVVFAILRRQLGARAQPSATPLADISRAHAAAVILSALARYGSSDPVAASRAYAIGATSLQLPAHMRAQPLLWDVALLDLAIRRLDRSSFSKKKELLFACGAVVAHDGLLTLDEAEIMRAVSEALGCPLPAFI